MSTRVYELAKMLGVESKVLLEMARDLGIDVASHSSNLSDEDVGKLTAATSEVEGRVIRFDKTTGKGEVSVTTSGARADLPFDLKWTRLSDAQYVPIRPGGKVRVTLKDQAIDSMHVEQA